MRRLPVLLITVPCVASGLAAQQSPCAGLGDRDVKALSAEQVRQLEAGEGMGLALAAELNRYPGPRHVLDLRDSLALTPAQVEAIGAVTRLLEPAQRQRYQVLRGYAGHGAGAHHQ